MAKHLYYIRKPCYERGKLGRYKNITKGGKVWWGTSMNIVVWLGAQSSENLKPKNKRYDRF